MRRGADDAKGLEGMTVPCRDLSVIVLAVRPVDMTVAVVRMVVIESRRAMVVPMVLRLSRAVVVVVVVVVVIVAVMIVATLAVVVSHALRPEGARDRRGRAALTTNQFCHRRIFGDIEHVGSDLGRDVVAAELPGEAQEPGRVLRPDFEKRFGGGTHRDEAAIVEAQGVAVLEAAVLLQGEGEAQASLGGEAVLRRMTGGMVEDHGVDHGVQADRRLADDGCGAQHGVLDMSFGGELWIRLREAFS